MTSKIRGPWEGVNLLGAKNPNLIMIDVELKSHLGMEGKLELALRHCDC